MKLTREETKELIKLMKEFVQIMQIKLKDFYTEVGITKQAVQKMGEGAYSMQPDVAARITKGVNQFIKECEIQIMDERIEVRNKLKKLSELKAYVNRFNNN